MVCRQMSPLRHWRCKFNITLILTNSGGHDQGVPRVGGSRERNYSRSLRNDPRKEDGDGSNRKEF